MANHHFGNLGDIWKHLPLGEILRITLPEVYAESHAGSAQYELSRNTDRDFGVYHFYRHGIDTPALSDSAFFHLLKVMTGEDSMQGGVPTLYPGSSQVAMHALRGHGTAMRFCDIDGKSIQSIEDTAPAFQLPPEKVHCMIGDGIAGTMVWVSRTPAEQAGRCVVFIDPFHVAEPNALGDTSLDLFATAAKKGMITVLWHCALSREERVEVDRQVREAMTRHGLSFDGDTLWSTLWSGEIALASMNEVGFAAPGVACCSMLCANLHGQVVEHCRALGEALVRIYRGTTLPSGLPGDLEWHELPG